MADQTLSWLAPLSTADFVQQAVANGIADNQDRSELASLEMSNMVNQIGDLLNTIGDVPTIDTQLGNVTTALDSFTEQTQPVKPAIDAIFPDAPTDVVLGTVDSLAIDPIPILTAAEPSIAIITPPTKFTTAVPVAEALPDRMYPDAPTNTMPTAPVMRTLTLPSAPSILAINFEGITPAALDAPAIDSFTFTEQDYQSVLMTNLKDKLLSLVLNTAQTGLSAAVEQQIWDRARERTASSAQGAIDNISRQFARAGWSIPTGDEIESIYKATEAKTAEDMAESRNIAVTQAQLEQSNFQFSFTQAVALEGQLLNYHSQTQQRALEAAKYIVEAAINLFQMRVAYFNANVALYTAQSQVYRDRIQAELAKVELFKAELDGQRLIGELNAQDISNYKAQIDAVVAVFGLYKDELEAVKTQLEGDRLKVSQFEANIRAFAEQIRAKSLEYDGYKAELSGEEVKAKIYDSLVAAFGKRIDAFKTATDAKVQKLDADIKTTFEVPLKVLEQRTEVFKSRVQAKVSEIEGATTLYKADADVYKTNVTAESAKISTQVEVRKQDVDYLMKQADVSIEAVKANIATFLAQKELVIGTLKTIAQVESQLAAAFGSAVNYSAGMHAGESQSYSQSNSVSASNSISDSTVHSD
jgi:hypothetical protein